MGFELFTQSLINTCPSKVVQVVTTLEMRSVCSRARHKGSSQSFLSTLLSQHLLLDCECWPSGYFTLSVAEKSAECFFVFEIRPHLGTLFLKNCFFERVQGVLF